MAKVLVVDDEKSMRFTLREFLRDAGYEVGVAENVDEAIGMLAAENFDVVISDIIMPRITGIKLLKSIKEKSPNVQVILMTGEPSIETASEAVRAGAFDYLSKPIDEEQLLKTVANAVKVKALDDERRRLAEELAIRNKELNDANKFIKQTFGRYVSDDFVESMLKSPDKLELGGEQRIVTVLMSDLRAFTSISERMMPSKIIELMNMYFEKMVDVILEFGGTIDGIIGDAILVVFGAPKEYQDHASRAVACAITMQRAMESVNRTNKQCGFPEIEMGIGVHTGVVIVGNIGSKRHTKYGVLGRNVNLAGRIESITIGGQILISESSRSLIAEPLTLGSQIVIDPKGAKSTMTLHEVWGIGGDFNIALDRLEPRFSEIPNGLEVKFSVLEEKFVGRAVFEGKFLKIAPKEAIMESHTALEPLNNLRICIKIEVLGVMMEDEHVYGKVVEYKTDRDDHYCVRFTSISPNIQSYFKRLASENT